ncbi:MAG: hypothetical protein WBO55_02495 [Rhizobiaceae bacterium]
MMMMRRNLSGPDGLIVVICMLQIAAVLAYLLRNGRLSIVPIYDDVVYLIDGMERLAALDAGGLWGLLASFTTSVAHAPLLSLLGAFGLLVSGGAVWGAYLMNAVWVFAALALSWLLMQQLSPWSRFGIALAMLAAPMFGYAVAEFRPDVGWGLLVGFSAALLATCDLRRIEPPTALWLGALLGICVLAKPSASPATVVVLVVAYLAQLPATMLPDWRASIGPILRRAALISMAAIAVLLPYLITSGNHVLSYILNVMLSEREVWETKASFSGHLMYYINKGTAPLMLGWFWYLGLPILVTCVLALVWRRSWPELQRFAGLLAALAVAYVIPSLSPVKSLLIGSLVYGSFIATVVYATAMILRSVDVSPTILVIAGVVIYAYNWTPRAGMIHRDAEVFRATDSANRTVSPIVIDKLEAIPPTNGRPTVLVTVPGPVYAGTMDFLSRQGGVVGEFISAYTWSTWEMFADGIASADILIAQEPGMVGQALGFNFPSVAFQDRIIETLNSDASFVGAPAYTDPDGRSVWVFSRRR